MPKAASSGKQNQSALQALNRRAEAILKARPAYREMVDFYLTVFRRQIEWRDRLVVHPQTVDDRARRQCFQRGDPLIAGHDPGMDAESLLSLWMEMKAVFRRGNDVLRRALERIDAAEQAGDFAPAAWLAEQRPDRSELLTDGAERIGVEEPVLASLARAVTFPHWEMVTRAWLPDDRLEDWKRFPCPTCGGLPGLAETRSEAGAGDCVASAARRLMHCPFCGAQWTVPAMECPACGSTKSGDAKYLFTADEPELRIDFCRSCHHYVKVIDRDKISGPIHVGLELLAATHLDMMAKEKNLSPLEVSA